MCKRADYRFGSSFDLCLRGTKKATLQVGYLVNAFGIGVHLDNGKHRVNKGTESLTVRAREVYSNGFDDNVGQNSDRSFRRLRSRCLWFYRSRHLKQIQLTASLFDELHFAIFILILALKSFFFALC